MKDKLSDSTKIFPNAIEKPILRVIDGIQPLQPKYDSDNMLYCHIHVFQNFELNHEINFQPHVVMHVH